MSDHRNHQVLIYTMLRTLIASIRPIGKMFARETQTIAEDVAICWAVSKRLRLISMGFRNVRALHTQKDYAP